MAKKDHLRTYKEIGEFVMSKIAELGEADRLLYQKELTPEDKRGRQEELATKRHKRGSQENKTH